ncbi:ArsR/SmtB family transcription factor [Nitratidesulfovibrio vulgaris]|uniref:Transcriptional regulator, ArsR family/methyltransferase, UbiE/COQ5 family n=2 Tax=Nitratidesulfovibrio vulgaris TaxID=881 RepID=Q72EH2_NITV2|nr:metalloregulator ArsR/SmtB family transcription factor [Nitratidesulfovibrio vulgaris]GEB80011.1 ArsR family transcriptional regulator [Desulfovibrio desulfuricans]AAS95087.1 transcriptional regulator, ArsR family/methyltransferase, UbiE/COQ5 family [Nitratidesulfovibrio vulgaris str. Hildenborough]ABM29364.1 transcriptional regulator, ArsR family [Nitratidesulfovibrio vulgaris DP4]ADP85724.1 transcriptional regulator, ArsR family [Nitratidesulfovibrio vulgaris RCH1]WCB46231.1 metalloregula
MSLALQYFKALSDETRLRLIHVLNRHELSVNELVSILEMGQSRVSRHLKILTGAGLLTSRRDGLWVFYSAAAEGDGRAFLDAVTPFVTTDMVLQADLDMAQKIIEERALKTRQFFNAIAEDWDELNREVLGGFDLAGAVAEAMPQCETAVDLGCGTGSVIERMLQRSQQVIGVDGSPRMLELARRRFVEGAERVSLRIGELDHLPLRDGEADFASINMVLHHLSDPGVALGEIRRVLRLGGQLMVTDFDRHDNERMRSDYGDRWLGFEGVQLEGLLREAGFTVRECRRQGVAKGLALHLMLAEKTQQ